MATDAEIEAAAAVIFAHHQFKGDDYIARLVAKYALEAAEKARTSALEAELETARKFVREKPSTSYLQRRMQITYNHANMLMDKFEAEGLVSAPNHCGVRTLRPADAPSAGEEK